MICLRTSSWEGPAPALPFEGDATGCVLRLLKLRIEVVQVRHSQALAGLPHTGPNLASGGGRLEG